MLAYTYKQALATLRKGGVVVFPCDTVMGIGCAMDKPRAIKRLYTIKKRPQSQPTAVLVADMDMARSLTKYTPDKSIHKVMKNHWPGALTIVVKASEVVPHSIMGGTGEVGIRIPDFPPLQELIHKLGTPLVATSANFKGHPAPVTFEDIVVKFLKNVDYAIKEDSSGSVASTVVRYKGKEGIEYIRKGEVEV